VCIIREEIVIREEPYNRTANACSGRWSEGSMDRLSGREIGAIRKLVADKEREERKCNIAIKGIIWKDKDIEKGKKWAHY